jgi:hypothetical protein
MHNSYGKKVWRCVSINITHESCINNYKSISIIRRLLKFEVGVILRNNSTLVSIHFLFFLDKVTAVTPQASKRDSGMHQGTRLEIYKTVIPSPREGATQIYFSLVGSTFNRRKSSITWHTIFADFNCDIRVIQYFQSIK